MTDEQGRKIDAEIAKLMAETSHLNAQTAKIARETWFVPFAYLGGAAALITAIFGAIKVLA